MRFKATNIGNIRNEQVKKIKLAKDSLSYWIKETLCLCTLCRNEKKKVIKQTLIELTTTDLN